LILCPYLKHRVPNEIWERHKCLVIHPGIEGDRGPSSLDWAITGEASQWGVTLVEAAEEMDAGNIWGTAMFPLRAASKASSYRREVTAKASDLIRDALLHVKNKRFKPRPLSYSDPMVTGRLMRTIQQHDRKIDWQQHNTAEIMRRINAADSSPGVLSELNGQDVFLYDAHVAINLEEVGLVDTGQHWPGKMIATSNEAVCVKTCDSALWITHLKDSRKGVPSSIKLPATRVLGSICQSLPTITTDWQSSVNVGLREVDYIEDGQVGFVYFQFYNGAMNTEQCERLRDVLIHAKQRPTRAIVLMGGEEFFSNGIHLNCIETAANPADESWRNINAMNDVVKEVLHTTSQLTIAALRTNAGAGGAVLAAACDHVIARAGVVLNVHYKSMGLYGSEYWTYILPKRVGKKITQQLVEDCLPTLASEAMEMGLVDCLLPEDWQQYHEQLIPTCHALLGKQWQSMMNQKLKKRTQDEKQRPLEEYRHAELERMHAIFYDQNSDYHEARRRFVFKRAATQTPLQLAIHRESGRSSSAA
jgi:putative two-component system protein, hydrogenase maturation factor HypX/HoxX